MDFKWRLLVLSLLFFTSSLFAQELNPVRSSEWDQIAKMYYKENGKGKMAPVFPPALLALNNKVVTLPGFIIPTQTSLTHQKFMLSVLPLAQCSFCGAGGIPNMIEVWMTKPARYTEDVIRLKGKLALNTTGVFGRCEVTLMNAEVVK